MTAITDKFAELKAGGFQPDPPDPPVVELPLPDGQGSFFTFNTGGGPVTIYFHPDAGAYEVHGAILAFYTAQGGPLGQFGYPISDEHDEQIAGAAVGRTSDFQRGSIFWNAADGQITSGPVVPLPNLGFELLVGIDVSIFQGPIDWQQVKTRGTSEGEVIDFAYIKATEGNTITDSQFTTNWSTSKGVLPRGAYHFFRAQKVVDDTRPQANNFINTVTSAGDSGDLPSMVDVESLPAGVSASEAAASLQFFVSVVEQGLGSRPIIYTYPSFWTKQMANTGVFHGYHLWIANYGAKRADGGFERRSVGPVIPGQWPTFSIWQNAVKPGVFGITGLVDRDLALAPSGANLATFLSQPPPN